MIYTAREKDIESQKCILSSDILPYKSPYPSNNQYLLKIVIDYYENVLTNSDPGSIYMRLDENVIVDNKGDFPYRYIIAAWLELYFDKPIKEIKEINGSILEVDKNKIYPIIKGTLETLIKRNMSMYGCRTIAAAYLYEMASRLDKDPEDCVEFGINGDAYRHLADVIEKKYDSFGEKKM